MANLSLGALVERLTAEARSSLEQAAANASSRSHHSVEVVHWLFAMNQNQDPIINELFKKYRVVSQKLHQDLESVQSTLKTGCDGVPGLAPHTVSILQSAWMLASIEYQSEQIEAIHLLHAVLVDDTSYILSGVFSSEIAKIQPEELVEFYHQQAQSSVDAGRLGEVKPQPYLEQYTINLTEQAKLGKIDPVVGRDEEIRLMIDILLRRRQNNPILTGEAGVGKTAVVEGLANKIAQDRVPPALKGVSILSLDLALLQAGAGMKGEFENRLKGLVQEIQSSAQPIILFIDEAHGLIGGGNAQGQGDAANILKPALARGEIRTVAATTWGEYKKYVEKDAALARRFQVVKIEEPSEEAAIEMLRCLVPAMQEHHQVTITNQAIKAAVTLSHRYMTARQLPDKAISVLDTACSRVSLTQNATPSEIERRIAKKASHQAELEQLMEEQALGRGHGKETEQLTQAIRCLEDEIETLNVQWQQECDILNKVQNIQKIHVEEKSLAQDTLNELTALEDQLANSEQQLVYSHVNEALIAEVISSWTGIPLGALQSDEVAAILTLEEKLKARVVGQDHALNTMAETIRIARANLADESKPNGVFFLCGPSGVGKTESALAIAEQVYGSESNITVINMSEFKEEHKVSMLLGAPPGYVGYGEGGVLTEAVRRNPYSVILLDEMEKAHPGVQDVFYQIFDKGNVKDGEGRDIDFKNTTIIMTSNAGSETTIELCHDPELMPDTKTLRESLQDDLLSLFKPAFLGRIKVIPYLPLTRKVLENIARLKINKVINRIDENYGINLCVSNEVIGSIIEENSDLGSGARAIQAIVEASLLPIISREVLNSIALKKEISKIELKGKIDNISIETTQV